ncbi:type II toxin-antitoxin system VapC family toxin [Luteolibacter ambystomatis]|uniref:Type II toxin-antitoxin system VapC family toxin n=1 Tax=Luteolibacter ambystomatis TaxID=2824561 RepID=A0A975IZE2_9BACT|nr:type II toxin-antitoxin system VapC family toxin [Luteolibacter ambystomatis]QUE51197.1 type II toxin-antitoxin system VapC family toxin [Luteolibacter ambystomatis]
MRLLLDTHALLWMIADDPRLSPSARRHITSADELAWSVASLWEIAIKLSLDRPDFKLGRGWARLIPEEMTRNGVRRIDLSAIHCETVSRLPWHHRDPFDRLLVAQAATDGLAILSADNSLDAYAPKRLW